MQPINIENITLDKLSFPLLSEKKISLSILRLDKIHSIVSGNKWFKLRYYLEDAANQKKKTILTFGGAWSNHILATAAACRINNFNCIGIIRGEESKNISSTLQSARELGMKLFFIDRIDYKKKIIPREVDSFENYLIPEGGSDKKGVDGAATILDDYETEKYSHICCAAGTGTMAAGILKKLTEQQELLVISVLKNYVEMEKRILALADRTYSKLKIFHDYHFGGYAKCQSDLLQFMNEFYRQTNIPTDFVYTGKMCYAMLDLIKKDQFPINANILMIHSGGLQGNNSLNNGTLIF